MTRPLGPAAVRAGGTEVAPDPGMAPEGIARRVALAAIALGGGAAEAHRPARFEAICPVCDHRFAGAQAEFYDGGGGRDRDFLTHAASADEQPFLWEAWTCPQCWYTGFVGRFGKASPAVVARLKEKNTLAPVEPIDPRTLFTDYIPAFVRYDLLIQVLELDPDTPPGLLAHAHVRAAQTQRFRWQPSPLEDRGRCQVLLGLAKADLPKTPYERDMAAAGAFEKLFADRSNGIAARDRAFALARAAQLYKMRGEDTDAARAVALARKAGEIEPGLEDVLRDIETRIAREREHSLRAVPYLEKVLGGGGCEEVHCLPHARSDAEARAFCAYLLGVIHRKTGEPEKALGRLEPLLDVRGLPKGFDAWVRDEIRKAKG